jgi:hypothetical protein
LERVHALSAELSRGRENSKVLVRELFDAIGQVHAERSAPQAIATAPKVSGAWLLLFCPAQGGWLAGEWVENSREWRSVISPDRLLEPTHWLPTPDDPPSI